MKKLIAIILSITLMFSFMAVPASAALDNSSDTSISTEGVKSIFERIGDVFHNLIARIFKIFGLDCPLCENHDGYGEAGGEGEFNKAEAAAKYNEAVNQLKAYKRPIKIKHTSNLDNELQEVSGVTAAIKNIIEDVLEDFEGKNISVHNFGYGDSDKISNVIPPYGKEAKLNGAYIDYINYTHYNDKVKIDFRLNDSESHFDGTNTTSPVGYSDVFEPINLSEIELGTGKIKSADIAYRNATAEAVINEYGNVEYLKTDVEITVDVTIELSGKTSQFKIVSHCVDEYEMTY